MNGTIPPPLPAAPQSKTSALAIWSLVLGILSVVLMIICVGFVFAIPAIICGHIAFARINRSGGLLEGKGMAIAGFVTGYVCLAMLPLMMAIAIPNFVRAREVAQANVCINNLRQIDAAKNQWALENDKPTGTPVTEADITPYLKPDANGDFLKCPAGGTYTIGAVGDPPTCSLGETVTPAHVLPQNDF